MEFLWPPSLCFHNVELLAPLHRVTWYGAQREGRPHAVRVQWECDGLVAAQCRREALASSPLRHSALPRFVLTHAYEGRVLSVRQPLPGQPLSGRKLAEERLMHLAVQLAEALQELHSWGLDHGCLSPRTIWLSDQGEVSLADLGQACHAPKHVRRESLSELVYCSPEQLGVIKRCVDGRADLYALGAILFECATGRPLFRSDDAGELFRQQAAVVPPPVQEAPPVLRDVIARLLAKDPMDRFRDPTALLKALQAPRPAPPVLRPAKGELRKAEAELYLCAQLGGQKLPDGELQRLLELSDECAEIFEALLYQAASDGQLQLQLGEWKADFAQLRARPEEPPRAPEVDALAVRLELMQQALLGLTLEPGLAADPDKQAEAILELILKLLGGERTLLFLWDGNELLYKFGRAAPGQTLEELPSYSSSVVKSVWENSQPVIVLDAGQWGASTSIVLGGLRSIMATPLTARNRSLGVLYVDNRLARGVFTENDLSVLATMARQIAQAFEVARAAQLELQLEGAVQQRRLAEQLREAILNMSATLEKEQVMERFLGSLRKLVPFDVHTVPSDIEEGEASHGQLVLRLPVGPVLLERTKPFAPNEAEIAYTLASQATVALENARLFAQVQQLASTDPLIGCWNRRRFVESLEIEIYRVKRHQRCMCALMIDIDHFKQFNDQHGHAVGDAVLKEVAHRCRQSLRTGDLFARYGGEEFAALLPETALADAAVAAERLRVAVAALPLTSERGPLTLTISLGVAEYQAGDDGEALFKKADTALYRAKAEGRNCVRVCQYPVGRIPSPD